MKKSLNFDYTNFKLFYLFTYFGLGAFLPYINLWLEKQRHFNGLQIGIITSISMLVGVLLLPLFGIISDKTQKPKQILILSLTIMIILLQFYQRQHMYIFILIIAALFEVFRNAASPIADTIASKYSNDHNKNFGLIRTFGSFGYLLGSVCIGMLLDYFGLEGITFVTYSIFLLLAIISATQFPNTSVDTNRPKEKINIFKILRNKKFYTLFLFVIFSTTLIDVSVSFIGNHFSKTLHASESFIGIYTFVMVLPEILFLPFAIKTMKKFGFKNFYLLTGISVAIRLGISAFTSNPYILLMAPFVHFMSVATSTVGNIYYIRKNFNENEIATVITLLGASIGIVRAIYNLLFGVIYGTLGSHAIFLIAFILCFISIILIFQTNIFTTLDKKHI